MVTVEADKQHLGLIPPRLRQVFTTSLIYISPLGERRQSELQSQILRGWKLWRASYDDYSEKSAPRDQWFDQWRAPEIVNPGYTWTCDMLANPGLKTFTSLGVSPFRAFDHILMLEGNQQLPSPRSCPLSMNLSSNLLSQ